MPTRRTFELIIVTVILVHPVIRAAHLWAAKHLATSANEATSTAAEVAIQIL